MFDIDRMTDEDLGKSVRFLLRGSIHDRLVAQRADLALMAQADDEDAKRLYEQEKALREQLKQKGFSLAGIVIPALDAGDEMLDALVPDNVRVPYNRAFHRLGMDLLDPEKTTWRSLLVQHIIWANFVKSQPQVAVVIDPTEKAKAIAEAMDITIEEATEYMEEAGL